MGQYFSPVYFSHYVFKAYFLFHSLSFPFWESKYTFVRLINNISQITESSDHFFQLFFPFCDSVWIAPVALIRSMIFLPVVSDQLLNPSSEVFISDIVIFITSPLFGSFSLLTYFQQKSLNISVIVF